jgi:hypothetical protein
MAGWRTTRVPAHSPGAAWVCALAALSAAPALKIGDVQPVEIVQALWLFIASLFFVRGGLNLSIGGAWRRYGAWYLAILFCSLGISALSLRLSFYPPDGMSFLKRPLALSAARIFELFLAIFFMLLIAEGLRSRKLLKLVLDVYLWTGMLSALVSITGWLALKTAGLATLVVYGYDDRVRGFFNEGGPYGMFLISVGLIAVLRARLFPPRIPTLFKLELATLAGALYLSGSKAGFLAVVILCAVAAMVAGSRTQRFAISGACGVALALLLTIFGGKFAGYAYAYVNLDEALAYRPDDPSLIMGRVAAAAIVPRMIAAHPVAGIGVGNYSLMRNDPDYLQGLPPVDEWDLPGVGLLGSAAEFGIPLAVAFVVVLLYPLFRARRARAPAVVAVAAAFQPVAFALGVNLNFFYPWLVAGIAMAMASEYESRLGVNQ